MRATPVAKRGRSHRWIATGLVGLTIVLVGCGGTGELQSTPSLEAGAGAAPTVASLTGVWLDTRDSLYVLFTDDGRFSADPTRGYLHATAYASGTYEIDDNRITFVFAETEICTEGQTSTWTASHPEPGDLEVEVTDDHDGSGNCRWGLGGHSYIRVGDS